MNTFRCTIVSTDSALYQGDVVFVVAPGKAGELGITAQHIPLITLLKPGCVVITPTSGEKQRFSITGGIMEVQADAVTILADTIFRDEGLSGALKRKMLADAEQCKPSPVSALQK